MIVNELVTKLVYRVDTRGALRYEQQMRALQRQAERSTRQMTGTFARATSAIGKMLNFSMKIHGIDAAKRQLGGVEQSIGKLSGMLKGLAAGYIGFQGVEKFAGFIKDSAGEYEVAMMRLKTLVGKDKAANVFKGLQNFAAKTPFELGEIMDLFTSLQGSGYDLMDRKTGKLHEDKIVAIGDAAAIAGKPLGQMKDMILGLGRGLANMFDNFSGAGFAGAKAEGGSISGEMVNVQSGAKRKFTLDSDNKQAIMDLIVGQGKSAGVAGGMKELAGTLPGMLSTMGDSFKNFGVQIWEGGLKYPVKSLMTDLQKLADKELPNLGAKIGQFFDTGAERLTVWFYKAKDALQAAAPFWKPTAVGIGLIASHLAGLKVLALFAEGGALFKFFGLISRIGPMVSGFMALASMAGPMATIGSVISAIGAALLPLLTGGAIIAVVAAIGGLGYMLWQYWQNGDKALAGMYEKFPWLAEGIKTLGDGLAVWWPELVRLGDAIKTALIGGFNAFFPLVKWGFENIFVPTIGIALKLLGDFFTGLHMIYEAFGWLVGKAAEFANKFQAGISTAISLLKQMMPALAPVIDAFARLFNLGQGGGETGAPGGSGPVSPGNAGLAAAAADFINSGRGDQLARRDSTGLFGKGVACNFLVNNLVQDAGGSSELLGQMTNAVPTTVRNLLQKGMVDVIPWDQVQPGDIAVAGNMGHIGMIGPGGRGQLIHASNSRGHEIGKGQRPVIASNYMGAGGHYYRIKPQYLQGRGAVSTGTMPSTVPVGVRGAGGGSSGIVQNMNFHGPVNPAQVKQAAGQGATEALNRQRVQKPKPTNRRGR